MCCSTTATAFGVSRGKSRPDVIETSLIVAPSAGTPMIVPCTLVFPFWRNTESVTVPRVFVAATPSIRENDWAMASVSPPITVRSAKCVSA